MGILQIRNQRRTESEWSVLSLWVHRCCSIQTQHNILEPKRPICLRRFSLIPFPFRSKLAARKSYPAVVNISTRWSANRTLVRVLVRSRSWHACMMTALRPCVAALCDRHTSAAHTSARAHTCSDTNCALAALEQRLARQCAADAAASRLAWRWPACAKCRNLVSSWL